MGRVGSEINPSEIRKRLVREGGLIQRAMAMKTRAGRTRRTINPLRRKNDGD